MTGKRIDQRRAVRAVMQQNNRLSPAGLVVGQQHGTKLAREGIGRWQRVGGRTGRAGRGALTASGADFRSYLDVIAIRRDCPGRAEIEAAVASGQL